MSAITPYEWAIIAFVIGVTFLCAFMLTVPLLLGGKSWGRAKQEQFESGVVGAGGRLPAEVGALVAGDVDLGDVVAVEVAASGLVAVPVDGQG